MAALQAEVVDTTGAGDAFLGRLLSPLPGSKAAPLAGRKHHRQIPMGCGRPLRFGTKWPAGPWSRGVPRDRSPQPAAAELGNLFAAVSLPDSSGG